MPNLATALKSEIRRLARKEIRDQVGATKSAAAQHRRDIAALKRQVDSLTRKLDFLEAQEKRRVAQRAKGESEAGAKVRFSPKGLKSHRARLGLSLVEYGKLLGVSGPTVLAWERGGSRPTKERLGSLAELRTLGKREVQNRLELLNA